MAKKCLVCGKRFTPTGRVQYCCSKKCSSVQKAKKERENRRKAGPKEVVKKCIICNKEFVKTGHNQNTCSVECCAEKKRRDARSRSSALRSKADRSAVCLVCGKEFEKKVKNQKCCCSQCKRKRDRQSAREKSNLSVTVHRAVRHNLKQTTNKHPSVIEKTSEKLVMGLTAEERRNVAYAQDVLPAHELYKASKMWSPKQHKYALERWRQKNGM